MSYQRKGVTHGKQETKRVNDCAGNRGRKGIDERKDEAYTDAQSLRLCP